MPPHSRPTHNLPTHNQPIPGVAGVASFHSLDTRQCCDDQPGGDTLPTSLSKLHRRGAPGLKQT